MLVLNIEANEMWNEKTNEFINAPAYTLVLEHSLVSLSKWESRWHKPFLSNDNKPKTRDETIDYIRCMTISPKNVPDVVYEYLKPEYITKVNEYIRDPMTATTFSKKEGSGRSRKILTNEMIYYYMIQLQIPPEFEKWHLNRLMTLIQVCNAESKAPGKMSKKDVMRRNSAINAANRAKYHSKG